MAFVGPTGMFFGDFYQHRISEWLLPRWTLPVKRQFSNLGPIRPIASRLQVSDHVIRHSHIRSPHCPLSHSNTKRSLVKYAASTPASPIPQCEAKGESVAQNQQVEGQKKVFTCPQCQYVTDRKNNLKRHFVTMHQECGKILECCNTSFGSKAGLRDHVCMFHHSGYSCRICGRNFCRKALLKRHLSVHSGQKDYRCALCSYATSHKSNLERHYKVHRKRIPIQHTHAPYLCQTEFRHMYPYVPDNYMSLSMDLHPGSAFSSHKRRRCLLPRRLAETHSKRSELSLHIPYNRNIAAVTENKRNINSPDQSDDIFYPNNRDRDPLTSPSRMCSKPYKCSECGDTFGLQTQINSHRCSSKTEKLTSIAELSETIPRLAVIGDDVSPDSNNNDHDDGEKRVPTSYVYGCTNKINKSCDIVSMASDSSETDDQEIKVCLSNAHVLLPIKKRPLDIALLHPE